MLIQEYDPVWKIYFTRIESVLQEVLAGLDIKIEHVGSTSVSGLAAKPVIDIDIIYQGDNDFKKINGLLAALGYQHTGDQGITGREVFKRPGTNHPVLDTIRHHLYACPAESRELKRHILFRDYLIKNEWARNEYTALKCKLAEEKNQDHKSYAKLKEERARDFILSIIKIAEMRLRVETPRLIIRNFTEDDWEDLYEYLSLEDIYQYEPGDPVSRLKAKELARKRSKSSDFLAVELKSNKKMAGHLYFKHIEPKKFLTWELGFIFNPAYQNRGYATEAAKAVMNYAFTELRAHRIAAYCNTENTVSCRVLENLGMRREACYKKKAYFKRNKEGAPIWFDSYKYAVLYNEMNEGGRQL